MNKERKTKPSSATRRKTPWFVLTSAAVVAALVIWANLSNPLSVAADIVVYKSPACSCCGNWVAHLRDAGLEVRVINKSNTQAIKASIGVPPELRSCHTAVVGDYWVEGHVPADLIQKLVSENPENILGIAAPGMPAGSPGMEGPSPVKFDIVAHERSGNSFVYATRQGRTEPAFKTEFQSLLSG